MYDLFAKQELFNICDKENIYSFLNYQEIEKCAFHERSNQFLIVFSVANYDLIFFYLNKSKESSEDFLNDKLNLSNKFVNGLKTNNNDKNKIVIRFPSNGYHGEIKGICFNSVGDYLFVLFSSGIIIEIPTLEIPDAFLINQISNIEGILVCESSILHPNNIIVWYSLDATQEIAIVANDLGEICFIKIETKSILRKTSINKSVKSLRIVRDKFTITLLITANDNSQWKLPLEKNRLSMLLNQDNDADNVKFMEENKNRIFSCFNFENSFSLPNDTQNDKLSFSPSEIKIKKKNSEIEEVNCAIINQQSFILATYIYDNYGYINIYEGNEFTYEFTIPLSKYIFPKECIALDNLMCVVTEKLIATANSNSFYIISKQCSDFRNSLKDVSILTHLEFESKILAIYRLNENTRNNYLDTFIVITNSCAYKIIPMKTFEQAFIQLITTNTNQCEVDVKEFALMMRFKSSFIYEKAAQYFLENNQYQKAFNYFFSAKTSYAKQINCFLSFGYINEVLSLITFLFNEKSSNLKEQDKIDLSNLFVTFSVQKILEKNLDSDKQKQLNKLEKFLLTNLYYNENLVIKLLIESYLFKLAEKCAIIRNNYVSLIENLLKVNQLKQELFGEKMCKFIEESDYSDVFNESFQSNEFFECLLTSDILQGFILKPHLVSTYLKMLVEVLPYLDNNLLIKASCLFDPHKLNVQIILNKIVDHLNEDYMEDEKIKESEKICKMDLVNFYIFVVLILLKNKEKKSLEFDERILEIIDKWPKKNSQLSICKSNIQNDSKVFSGQSISFLIKNNNLFTWGFSKFGSNGCQSKNEFENFSPFDKPLQPKLNTFFSKNLLIKVKDISCGSNHTLILTEIGCFAVGLSTYGQLGCGNLVQYTKYPKLIEKLSDKILKVSSGQYHSLAITKNNEVYSWGWGLHGQLGHGDANNIFEPKLIKYFKNISVVDVSGGYIHSLVLDSNGYVYSFGNNNFGQLGVKDIKKRSFPKRILKIQEPIDLISSKYFISLAINKKKKQIYTWGISPQCLQLRIHQVKKNRVAKNFGNGYISHYYFKEYSAPDYIFFNEDDEIVKIDTGFIHCMLLTKKGRVYSWGRNPDGQLGQGREREILEPTIINSLLEKQVVDISCGFDFSVLVCKTGELYCFGNNIYFQLGFQSKINENTETGIDPNVLENKKIKANKKVFSIFSSKYKEKNPIKVDVSDDQNEELDYLENTSVDFPIIEYKSKENYSQNKLETDYFNLANVIMKYKYELDLNYILNTSLKFETFLCTAFIYEILKDPLKSIEYYFKAAINCKQNENSNLEKIFIHFFLKNLHLDCKTTKNLIDRFIKIWLNSYLEMLHLEKFIINVYENKISNFMFGILFFELIDENEKELNFSNSFKIKMMEITITYLQNSKISQFMAESATSFLTSLSNNQNLLSAEKLWKNILNDIQNELSQNYLLNNQNNSNGKKNYQDQIKNDHTSLVDVSNKENVEILPEDNQFYVFSCNHHCTKSYFDKILKNQIQLIQIKKDKDNKNMDNDQVIDNISSYQSDQTNFKNMTKCPFCPN